MFRDIPQWFILKKVGFRFEILRNTPVNDSIPYTPKVLISTNLLPFTLVEIANFEVANFEVANFILFYICYNEGKPK